MQVQDNEKTYYQICSICCQSSQRGYRQVDLLRPAQICYHCWHNHILNIVNRISYMAGDNIMSPFNNGPSFDIISCLNSLLPEHSDQIQQRLYTKYTSFTQDIQKCPGQNCDFVYVGQQCKWNRKQNVYNCPKCDGPLNALGPYSFKSIMAAIYLLLANKCPKCQIPIEKISGCPHMTCPCGHEFCWYCYKDQTYGKKKRLYNSHNIPQCSFIVASKIILILICLAGLMFTSNGNSTVKYIQQTIFAIISIVFRALIIDGWVLIQILVVMMRQRRRRVRVDPLQKRRFIALMISLNFLIMPLFLYSIGELSMMLTILVGQILLSGIIFGIGYAIVYSLDTWFQFIA